MDVESEHAAVGGSGAAGGALGAEEGGAGPDAAGADGAGGAAFRERVVLPGDDVTDSLLGYVADGALKLGNGLQLDSTERILATKAGVLAHRAPNRFFVLTACRRYTPAVGDTVVGVVVDRAPEYYRVRLHGTSVAHLPVLAFDGASKRNKPSLAVGAVVFARVAACSKHMEPELSCCAVSGPRKDWTTGQSMFGELRGGTLLQVSSALARRLLDPGCALLSTLGGAFPFEVAVGLNGLVWVAAGSSRHVAAVCSAVERAEFLTEEQCASVAKGLAASLAS